MPALRPVAALLLGSLLPLAFAPFFIWPLAVAIPALMIALLRAAPSARHCFAVGWLFGVGYFGFGVYWIYNSLHDFGMAPPAVAAGITGLLVVYLALAPALVFLCHFYSQRRLGDAGLWLLPCFWFSLEWIKGWFLTGMPWLSLGYSQTGSPLAGFAPLIGVYGIGALCVALALALYLLLRDKRYSMAAPLLLIPALGALLQQLDWTEALDAELRVTMVQGNIPQEIKWRYDQRQDIFNTYWRETEAHWDSDLVIWPETALPGHSEEIETSVLTPLQQAARANGSALLTGLVVSERDSGRFFNSAVLLAAERGYYHKRHLVLFGEYYPMRWLLDLFSGLISIPFSDLTAGPDEQQLMRVRDVALGLSICFEDAFSRDILRALPGANLLVNLSNDAWFGNSTAPHQHMQIAQMRAQETRLPMLRATNTGVSAFIDHRGAVLLKSRQFATESISATLRGRDGLTPFYYFAKIQGLLALLPFAALVILVRRKPPAKAV